MVQRWERLKDRFRNDLGRVGVEMFGGEGRKGGRRVAKVKGAENDKGDAVKMTAGVVRTAGNGKANAAVGAPVVGKVVDREESENTSESESESDEEVAIIETRTGVKDMAIRKQAGMKEKQGKQQFTDANAKGKAKANGKVKVEKEVSDEEEEE